MTNWAERSVEELNLSVRSSNGLDRLEIRTIEQLCAHSEQSLLKAKNFGKTSLREVKRKLEELGLSLGTPLPKYSPSPIPQMPGLRDYFAAQALPVVVDIAHRGGLHAPDMPGEWDLGDAAKWAYDMADCMLAARDMKQD